MRQEQPKGFRHIRALAWRFGRYLYRWARREGDNDPPTNGEYWLMDLLVSQSELSPLVLMDIGANKGEWSDAAITSLKRHGKRGAIHAFEPTESTFQYMSNRFAGEESVTLHHLALSNRSGEADIYVIDSLCGRNSLHGAEGTHVERVRVQSVDGFLEESGLRHIAMVKSDTEGHDLSVLEGGQRALREGRVDVWQFEYNHRWLFNRASLMAVFDLIEDMPYSLGKLYGDGIELYEQWHFELDRFFETNFVLVRNGSVFETMADSVSFDSSNAPTLHSVRR
jgi:FkbM family methyltransferase